MSISYAKKHSTDSYGIRTPLGRHILHGIEHVNIICIQKSFPKTNFAFMNIKHNIIRNHNIELSYYETQITVFSSYFISILVSSIRT